MFCRTNRIPAPASTGIAFDDEAPLAQPSIAETREYMTVGVLGDEEIGQPSDIVSALLGG